MIDHFAPQLTLPFPDSGFHPGAASEGLGVLTWNVQHASLTRAQHQAAWLAAEPTADIVLLTEVSRGAGGRALARDLSDRGYHVLLPKSDDADYRVVLASRVGPLRPFDLGVSGWSHRCPAAVIDVGATCTLGLVGLYVPSRGPQAARNTAKRAFQSAVVDALPRMGPVFGDLTGGIVIAGDLNVVEPGHIPHHAVFGTWEYDFYRAFAAAGFFDAYRTVALDSVDHSWMGARSGQGYRFDHIFTNRPERLLDCRYLHFPRQNALSDHSAMVATLTLDDYPIVTSERPL